MVKPKSQPSPDASPPPEASSPDADPETEARILDAAHAVFLRRGTAGARMQEIADEAGVNKALLHYYFRSKERLAEAVFMRAARRLLPPVLAVLASDASIEDKVRRVVDHELTVLSETPDLPGYVLSEMHHRPDRLEQVMASLAGAHPGAVLPRVLGTLARQIDEEVRAGRMRPVQPEQFLVNLISLCMYPFAARPMLTVLLGRGAEGFEAFIEERRRSLPDFFLGALRP
jgi:TetR/AcrR family transcriptional regulator